LILAAARVTVSGRVQGVGFRYFVYQSARRRGLTGTVRNLVDGTVEVIVQGERTLVDDLIVELKIGPPAARVDDIDIAWFDALPNKNDFQII
jgi:acylphosphatase